MVAAQAAGRFLMGCCLTHAAFNAVKVMLALAGLSFEGVDTAMGGSIGKCRLGNLHIGGDNMAIAKIIIYICSCNLTGSNGADNGGGAGYAVTAGEEAFGVLELAAGESGNCAALDFDVNIVEGVGFNALTNSSDDNIGRHTNGSLVFRIAGFGSAVIADGSDNLRLNPKGGAVAILINFNAGGRREHAKLGAFGNCTLDFLFKSGHILLTASINAGNLLCAKTDSAADTVHSNVAAADNDNLLAGEIGHFAVTNAAKEHNSGDNAFAVLPFYTNLLIGMSADGDINAVIIAAQLIIADVLAHIDIGYYINGLSACGEDILNFLIKNFSGQTIVGNAIAEHTAKLLASFIHGYLMTHDGKIICCGKAAGATADNGNLLAGGGEMAGRRHIGRCVINSIALKSADINGIINHVSAAASLAGMLADIGAGGGERIILADKANSIVAASFVDKGNVTGNIHSCRAKSNAGHGIFQTTKAAIMENMLHIIIAEAMNAVEDDSGGLSAYGAVGAGNNNLGGFLDKSNGLRGAGTVKNVIDKSVYLSKTYAAGNALTAGLSLTHGQEAKGHINRAKSGRRGRYATLY